MKDYKRLTTRNEKGEWTIELNEEQKLLQCNLPADEFISVLFDQIAQRLCDLEDKIENGTLVELPCKVGDIVYQLDNGGEIYELMILTITIHTNKFYYETLGIDFDNRAIGETIFLTKAEAEAKLRELKGERE